MAMGRRGINITQFLRDLQENPAMVDGDQPSFALDPDLSMFTNTEFFDLETGQNTDFQPQPPLPSKQATLTSASASSEAADSPADGDVDGHADTSAAETVSPALTTTHNDAMSGMADFANGLDFIASGDFNFPNFNASYSPYENLSSLPPIQAGSHSVYSSGGHVSQSSISGNAPHHSSHNAYGTSAGGAAGGSLSLPPVLPQSQQRPQHHQPRLAAADPAGSPIGGSLSRSGSIEEQARVAAEEDKRRRNTAASARFRVKKKQREQALEKSAKEMTAKVTSLESRIQQLETQNKWLKSMVLEKNAGTEEQLATLLENVAAAAANSAKNGASAPPAPEPLAVRSEESDAIDESG